MTRVMKAIKYLVGKSVNALCPVCGRWMTKDEMQREGNVIDIWYCTNPSHKGTKKN
jgi:hypothetical protein